MANSTVDISSLEDAPAQATAQSAAGAPPPPMGTQQGVAAPAQKTVDISQFESMPNYANGMSPATPLNTSPVSILDRLKLATGNDRGRQEYLKSKFEEVAKDSDGNFVVKDQGAWHRVEGKIFGDVDAWTATKGLLRADAALAFHGIGLHDIGSSIAEGNPVSKEIMSRVAEKVPTATALAGTAAAAYLTGGTSLIVQTGAAAGVGGGMEAARTSLGRLYGTYQATPEEQVQDVAFESMLNMGGVVIPAGLKPTAGWMADKLGPLASQIKKAGSVPMDLIKKTYGAMTVGVDNFETMMDVPHLVSGAMKDTSKAVGTGAAYVDHLTNNSIQQVKKAANSAQAMMSDVYNGLSKQIEGLVDKGFKADVQEITGNIFKKGIDDGFIAVRHEGVLLNPAEASELIASNAGRLPKEAVPVLRTMDEIKTVIQKTGDMSGGEIAFDKEAYGLMSDFFSKATDLHQIQSLEGRAGFNQLMKFNKILDDATFKIKVLAEDNGMSSVARQMAGYHDEIIGSAIAKKMEAQGLGAHYDAMKSSYSSMKSELTPLLAAKNQAMRGGGDKAYEQVLTRLSTKPGKDVAVKTGINSAIDTAEIFGSPYAKVIRSTQQAIRVNQAAIAFNPLVKPGLVGQGSATMAIGTGLQSMVSGSGNMGVPVALGTAALATSPRLASKVALSANAMWEGKQFLGSLTSEARQSLLRDPQALGRFMQSVLHAPDVHDQVKSHLLNQAGIPDDGQGQGQ